MGYHAAATATALLHLAFIIFVIAGGLLALRWKWVPWLHLPAAIWGVLIELGGWSCPLTSWENFFLRRAGSAGYDDGFIAHYAFALIYPVVLTRNLAIAIGVFVLLLNGAIYAWIIRRRRART